jgi:lysine 2,3-aminomutase
MLTGLLTGLRAAAPEAVLRLEVWLEGPAALLPAPEAIPALVAAQPLFVHAVVCRPEAWTPEAERFVRALADAGVPAAAEIVLRRGVLDAPDAVRALCLTLQRAGMRPYYLVDGAWLAAEARVARAEAVAIVRALRGWISGLAVPQLVEEGRDGRRTPVIPPYVQQLDAGGVAVVNYEGRRLRYANPPDERG